MANEFKIKNGFISTGNSFLTSGNFLGIGEFDGSTAPLYPLHVKTNASTNSYILIEADNDPRIAGVLFKTEDSDTNIRVKGGLFFDNSGGDAFGRGDFVLAINRNATNTNVTPSDAILTIDPNIGGDPVSTFRGELNADVKNFDIPHPSKEGWRLRYSVLEGPEYGVYIRGKVQGSDGIIELPYYWNDLIVEDSISVQLTPIGSSCPHYVISTDSNKVVVGCGCGEMNAYYTVFAERKYYEPLKVEYNPIK